MKLPKRAYFNAPEVSFVTAYVKRNTKLVTSLVIHRKSKKFCDF